MTVLLVENVLLLRENKRTEDPLSIRTSQQPGAHEKLLLTAAHKDAAPVSSVTGVINIKVPAQGTCLVNIQFLTPVRISTLVKTGFDSRSGPDVFQVSRAIVGSGYLGRVAVDGGEKVRRLGKSESKAKFTSSTLLLDSAAIKGQRGE